MCRSAAYSAFYDLLMQPAYSSHTTRQARLASDITLALICALGATAFLYPFFLASRALAPETAHAADAPLLFVLLGPGLLALALAEFGAGRLNAKTVAVLGALAAINAVLRLPAGPADAPAFFFLIILSGYVYGGRFGFLMGALSLLVSALLTGGVGPWMPFQMLVTGWMGLGAAAIRPLGRRLRPGGRAELALLCAYGYVWGLLYGALINLWFWPFAGAGALYWEPGLGLGETLRRYWAFYLTTSLAWDALRAIVNLLLIAALGRVTLKELRRFQARFQYQVTSDESPAQRSSNAAPIAGQ